MFTKFSDHFAFSKRWKDPDWKTQKLLIFPFDFIYFNTWNLKLRMSVGTAWAFFFIISDL